MSKVWGMLYRRILGGGRPHGINMLKKEMLIRDIIV